jgi:hypothetical protein
VANDLSCDEQNQLVIDIDKNAMATITIKNLRQRKSLEDFVKLYSELVPEMKERHHAQLVGALGRSAMAIGELDVKIASEPASRTFKVRMPLHTLNNSTDASQLLQYTLPSFCELLPAPLPYLRNYPMQRSAELSQNYKIEVRLAPEYEVISAPQPYSLTLDEGKGSAFISRVVSVEKMSSGATIYQLSATLKLTQMSGYVSPDNYLEYANGILSLRGYSNSFILRKTK